MIYFVHQSAKDYFTTGKGSSIFPSGPAEEHRKITRRSLKFMSGTLKRDICGLQMLGTLTSEVKSERVDIQLPKHIQYVFCYWVGHLQDASHLQRDKIGLCDDNGHAHKFLQQHFIDSRLSV
jgi:hypothetical protein